MKLNNKGFTLIEVLATVVILSLLMAIMVPSVSNIIKKGKESNYEDLKKSIVHSAKIYMSDHRYDVSIIGNCTDSNELNLGIDSNNIITLNVNNNGKLLIKTLIDEGNLKLDKNGNIKNPLDNTKTLDFDDSYVFVRYLCDKKDYSYELKDEYLIWN